MTINSIFQLHFGAENENGSIGIEGLLFDFYVSVFNNLSISFCTFLSVVRDCVL